MQGDLGRNALRGFGASQVDFTVQRLFRLSERFSLQSSADFFNIFTHPNFGAPINYMTSPQFGRSTQTLNSWLGGGGQSGGLNPLYQIARARSNRSTSLYVSLTTEYTQAVCDSKHRTQADFTVGRLGNPR